MFLAQAVQKYAIARRTLRHGPPRHRSDARDALEEACAAILDAMLAPEAWDAADWRAYRTLRFWREYGFRVPDAIVTG